MKRAMFLLLLFLGLFSQLGLGAAGLTAQRPKFLTVFHDGEACQIAGLSFAKLKGALFEAMERRGGLRSS